MGTILNIVLLLGASFTLVSFSDFIQTAEADHGGLILACPTGQIFEPLLGCIPEGTCPSGSVSITPTEHCSALQQVTNEEYKCYNINQQLVGYPPGADTVVDLIDQFQIQENVQLIIPFSFCASATKTMGDIHYVSPFSPFDGHHLTCHGITGDPPRDVDGNLIRVNIQDQQFGDQTEIEILSPVALCAPSDKELDPNNIDEKENQVHFKCYGIDFIDVNQQIQLSDQFERLQNDLVTQTQALCNPVLKFPDGAPPAPPPPPAGPHFLVHGIEAGAFVGPTITSQDQFASYTFPVENPFVFWSEVGKECINCPGPGNGGSGSIPVGGELIPLDTTMVLVAGSQLVAAWMIPVIVSAIGFTIVILRKL